MISTQTDDGRVDGIVECDAQFDETGEHRGVVVGDRPPGRPNHTADGVDTLVDGGHPFASDSCDHRNTYPAGRW